MICKKCKEEKDVDDFPISRNTRSGRRGKCKVCTNQDNSEWYERNKENLGPKRKEYQQSHREESAARTRKWRSNNLEKSTDQSHRRYLENKEKILEKSKINHASKPGYAGWKGSRRRARINENGGEFTYEELNLLYQRYDHKCLNPECITPEDILTPDHVIPLVKGGRNDIENIQPLCLTCNLRKGQRTIDFRT